MGPDIDKKIHVSYDNDSYYDAENLLHYLWSNSSYLFCQKCVNNIQCLQVVTEEVTSNGLTCVYIYLFARVNDAFFCKTPTHPICDVSLQVIAVVMDIFTDVDIFRDLLDAGFKRKVSVYILLERTTIPHFLSMCQRANMHAGHLKVS